jgi:enoyl-CoA hydratase
MSDSQILYGIRKNIAYIFFNRIEAMNAINQEMLEALDKALDKAAEDDLARAIIITGKGDKAFSAGADIRKLNNSMPVEVREAAKLAVKINKKIEDFEKPVIAAINGTAMGGGLEIAEACLIRIAVKGAMMGHPEVKLGTIAGWGGTTRLPRLIGRARAEEMLMTGRAISAEEALNIGLVHRIVDPKSLIDEAVRVTWEVLDAGPIATPQWRARWPLVRSSWPGHQ